MQIEFKCNVCSSEVEVVVNEEYQIYELTCLFCGYIEDIKKEKVLENG